MYVVGSEVVRTSRGGREEFVSENIGRERQEKSKRKREREEEEGRLSALFTRESSKPGAKSTVVGESVLEVEKKDVFAKKAFSAEAVKRIGFDPTTMKHIVGKPSIDDAETRRKVCILVTY